VGAPAVECSETEHELSEFERLPEVVVGAVTSRQVVYDAERVIPA
jgi:hypothetical protein